jgi:glycosyltransferase involved in cell wall biosynthesis
MLSDVSASRTSIEPHGSLAAIDVATPYGRDGPSSRVRVFEWLDRISRPVQLSSYVSHRNSSPSYLSRHPLAVLAAERRLRQMASHPRNQLLLHREASPLSRGGLERRLLSRTQFTVYDFDDALQWDWGEGGLYRRLAPKGPKAVIAVHHADRVIAGNPTLADWASEYNRDVVIIPSCVALEAYRRKVDYDLSDPPRLGWIGSADNEAYLQLVGPALIEIHRRTGARLTLISTTRQTLGELESIIDRVAWSETAQHALLAQLDVGIAPVPDEPYTRGKSGYKLLQYAAVGTPFIASPVGVNRTILEQTGMPAPENGDDWVDGILELLAQSRATRAARGERTREVAQRHYSYDAWLSRWEKAAAIP